DDTLIGGGGENRLYGDGGNDTAYYGDQDDAVYVDLDEGTHGHAYMDGDDDHLYSIENIVGSDHNDTITGDSGANVLDGNDGHDTIDGEGGNDTLIGGNGDDELTGGSGADTFKYENISDDDDLITDFDVAEGDTIDLDGLFDALGIATADRADAVTLTDGAGETVLTVDNAPGFTITLDLIDVSDPLDEAAVMAQINVGDES
ncbi:MAG: calcium-binding protein, partial [Pseudomonas marincola]